MKLAEALQERADIKNNIESLKERINNNVLVQDGEKPAEDPKKLIKELNSSVDRFCYLAAKINKTNSTVKVDGLTLTEVIAKKEALLLKVTAYRDMVYNASNISDRARGSEIRIIATVDVSKLQKEVDNISKDIRLLDNKLQEKNWTTDLIE